MCFLSPGKPLVGEIVGEDGTRYGGGFASPPKRLFPGIHCFARDCCPVMCFTKEICTKRCGEGVWLTKGPGELIIHDRDQIIPLFIVHTKPPPDLKKMLRDFPNYQNVDMKVNL